MIRLALLAILAASALCSASAAAPDDPGDPPGWGPPVGGKIPLLPGEKRPRKIFGHYMGYIGLRIVLPHEGWRKLRGR